MLSAVLGRRDSVFFAEALCEMAALVTDCIFKVNRKIPVGDVLRFPILMDRDSVDMELLKYFGYDTDTVPTQSAYIQQRSKLAPDTFRMVLDGFNSTLPVYLRLYFPVN